MFYFAHSLLLRFFDSHKPGQGVDRLILEISRRELQTAAVSSGAMMKSAGLGRVVRARTRAPHRHKGSPYTQRWSPTYCRTFALMCLPSGRKAISTAIACHCLISGAPSCLATGVSFSRSTRGREAGRPRPADDTWQHSRDVSPFFCKIISCELI